MMTQDETRSSTGKGIRRQTRAVQGVVLALVAMLAALAAAGAPAHAGPTHHLGTRQLVHEVESSTAPHRVQETRAQVMRFWTKERMVNARPLDIQAAAASTPLAGGLGPITTGPSVRIPGSLKDDRGFSSLGSTASTAADPAPWWNSAWGRWSMIGRLYTYDTLNREYGWCSATVVPAQNKSTIWTAGHCIISGGAWHRYLLFVPGQNGPGDVPYGKWYIRLIDANSTWKANSTCTLYTPSPCPWGADYGAAVASQVGGATLEGRVSSIGIWFGANLYNRSIRALGYPSSEPYYTQFGGYLFYCDSTPSTGFYDAFNLFSWTKACTMNGGASGGPWLTKYGTTWYLVSNNSNADTKNAAGQWQIPSYMNAPYLDSYTAKAFYDLMRAQ